MHTPSKSNDDPIQYCHLKRTYSLGLDDFLRQAVASAFATVIDDPISVAKPTLKETEEAISATFKKIHRIIEEVEDHIAGRMVNYENEVYGLVRNEMQEMKGETERVVQQLNRAIMEKNTQDQIWKLSNELDYFKSQTFTLFEENRKLRGQVASLSQQAKDTKVELENNDMTMQRLKKHYLKEKRTRQQMVTFLREAGQQKGFSPSEINNILSPGQLNHNKNDTFHTRSPQLRKAVVEQSRVEVDVEGGMHSPIHEERFRSGSSLPSLTLNQVSFRYALADLKLQKGHSDAVEPAMREEKGTQTLEIDILPSGRRTKREDSEQIPKSTKINFMKNGFYMRLYNQRPRNQSTVISSGQAVTVEQQRHSRYMSNAFDRNKLCKKVSVGGRNRTTTT